MTDYGKCKDCRWWNRKGYEDRHHITWSKCMLIGESIQQGAYIGFQLKPDAEPLDAEYTLRVIPIFRTSANHGCIQFESKEA